MNMRVYACYLRESTELNASSSGGAYTALSNAIFNLGGTVIACNYDYREHVLGFEKATDSDKRDRMRGSKYIQADPKKLYISLEEELKLKKSGPVLVVGTPCQIAGAKAWMNLKHPHIKRQVIFCDLICHGVSSPVMWQNYIREVEEINESKVEYLTFKDKEKGWIQPTAKVRLSDGKNVLIEDYAKLYRSDDFMRESCYHCEFTKVHRGTDITIGDFWSIERVAPEFANKQGTSVVLVHTEAGIELFETASRDMVIRESTLEECMQPNMQFPTKKTNRFDDIRKDYSMYGLRYIIERYVNFGPGGKMVRRIRRKIFRIKYGDK